jgi:hypothetical protein
MDLKQQWLVTDALVGFVLMVGVLMLLLMFSTARLP